MSSRKCFDAGVQVLLNQWSRMYREVRTNDVTGAVDRSCLMWVANHDTWRKQTTEKKLWEGFVE